MTAHPRSAPIIERNPKIRLRGRPALSTCDSGALSFIWDMAFKLYKLKWDPCEIVAAGLSKAERSQGAEHSITLRASWERARAHLRHRQRSTATQPPATP